MWLSNIQLKNFKSYIHAEIRMPEPRDGRNLVLIGGLNGFGKTTLLEAIYLCFYGDAAPPYLARSGISKDQTHYVKFLNQALNNDVKNNNEIGHLMSVKCTINVNSNRAFEIERKWHFKNGSFHDSEAFCTEVLRGIRQTPKKDGANGFRISPIIDQYFIPVHNAPFFIFDGEQIKLMADHERNKQIRSGLNDLVGVQMLREVQADLEKFCKEKEKLLVVQDMSEHQKKVSAYEHEIHSLNHEVKALQDELEENSRENMWCKESFDNKLKQLQRYGGSSASENIALHNDNNSLIIKDNEVTSELKSVLSTKFPFLFASNEHLGMIKKFLNNDFEFSKISASNETIIQTKTKFTDQFFSDRNFPFEPKLTEKQEETLKAKVKLAWEFIITDPNVTLAPSILFSVFNDQDRSEVLNRLNSVGIDTKRIKHLSSEREEIKNRSDEIQKKLRLIQEQSNDKGYQQLAADVAELQNKLDKYRTDIMSKENRLKSIEASLDNKNSEYGRERDKLGKDDHTRPLIAKARQTIRAIEEICRRLYDTKIIELSDALTKQLNSLMHKKQFIDKVKISHDGSLTILDRNGSEIEFDRSAGENQIFSTALLAALSEVCGKKSPLIVDTPLGRLDMMHRANLFEFWTKDENRQIILLVQDAEIDRDTFHKHSDKISTTYLLHHEDQNGGGITKAIENRFFYGR